MSSVTKRDPPSLAREVDNNPTGILGPREVVTSTELIHRLQRRGNSAANARQILRRSFLRANGIWRTDQLQLPAGGRLFARSTFFGDSAFLAKIAPILVQKRPGLARVLAALERFDGIDLETLQKLLAVRLDSSGRGAAFERELAAVVEVGIGQLDTSGPGRPRLVRRRYYETPESEKLARQFAAQRETERRLLTLMMKFYRQQHFIAWKTPDPDLPRPYNGGQIFSAVAYSPIHPLARMRQGRRISCPVLFESLARSAEVFDVAGFIERRYRAGDHAQSKLRMVGVMGARTFSPEAFQLGRRAGLLMVNYKELFGDVMLDMLATAESLLAAGEAGTSSTASNAQAEKLADTLLDLKSFPLISDLCGMALETFAVAALRGLGVEGLRTNLPVPYFNGEKEVTRDVDVSGAVNDVWYAVECKALRQDNEVTEAQVEKFFTQTVPSFLHHVGKNNIKTCHAEIWTTGTVSATTLAFLGGLKLDQTRIKPAIRTRKDIQIPAKLSSLSRLLDVIGKI
jgi:hypothetical protein